MNNGQCATATIRKEGGTSLSTFVLEKKWDQQQPSIKIRLQVQEFRSLLNSVAREVGHFFCMLAQLVKAVPKAAMQAPPKIKSRAPAAAKAQ